MEARKASSEAKKAKLEAEEATAAKTLIAKHTAVLAKVETELKIIRTEFEYREAEAQFRRAQAKAKMSEAKALMAGDIAKAQAQRLKRHCLNMLAGKMASDVPFMKINMQEIFMLTLILELLTVFHAEQKAATSLRFSA